MSIMNLPPIFLLSTHIPPEELHEIEDRIPNLTYDVSEAEVILGRISRPERALFELRRLGLVTGRVGTAEQTQRADDEPAGKRRRVEVEDVEPTKIKFMKLSWLFESQDQGELLPEKDYILFEGPVWRKPTDISPSTASSPPPTAKSILERAAQDQQPNISPRIFATSASPHSIKKHTRGHSQTHQPLPSLLHQSTSEHDNSMPQIPDYLHTTYSCQRPTFVDPPNRQFVEELKKIRTIRLLRGDQIGVRAYSTSISALAAYPFKLESPQEVARLPGCGAKIAELFHAWHETGQVPELSRASEDDEVKVLKLFYDIWGVGDTTAREFYSKGWRDLDDLVEYNWSSLSRVQQIGVKYYDEFQIKIPRQEVEEIARAIHSHARKIDDQIQIAIVGGYRRGKSESGDVDVILSHKNEKKTLDIIEKLIILLEKSKYVTHTLSLWTRNSDRGQVPLAWKGEGRGWGTGFDTLDKALVVWQNPHRSGESLHRRVDIIISPWKTVGCAILGWSGETTFQRDLRRYCKKEKNLKFDSSGIRSRADGSWVDLEAGDDGAPAPDMEEAEKRVFAGLGLEYRPPSERCTG